MKDFSAFLDIRRYKNWAHKIRYITVCRPVLSVASLPPQAQCLSAFHPELLSVGVESQQLQEHMF